MPTAGHGQRRYARHSPERLDGMVLRGADLGPPLKPQDMLIWLRLLMQLDDQEILDAFAAVLAADPAATFPELLAGEVDELLAASAEVTRSRVDAWRRRNREMTWLELRALLLGLRQTTR